MSRKNGWDRPPACRWYRPLACQSRCYGPLARLRALRLRSGFVLLTACLCSGVLMTDPALGQVVIKWENRQSNPGMDTVAGAVRDPVDQAIWITGSRSTGSGNSQFVTLKFSEINGALLAGPLVYNNGGTPGLHAATSIAIDFDRNIYVTGQSPGVGTGMDYATLSYDHNGVPRWGGVAMRYNNALLVGDDIPVKVVIRDPSLPGSPVFVTGKSKGVYGQDQLSTGFDYLTVKYDAGTGAQQIVHRYNHTSNKDDVPVGIGFAEDIPEGASYVLVTGTSFDNTTFNDITTVRFDGFTGATSLVHRWDNPLVSGDDVDTAVAMNVVSYGKGGFVLYWTGYTKRPDGLGPMSAIPQPNTDYVTAGLQINGTPYWSSGGYRLYNGPSNGPDISRGLSFAGDGFNFRLWVTGQVRNGTHTDAGTVMYDALTGTQIWAHNADRAGREDNGASLMGVYAPADPLGAGLYAFVAVASQDAAGNYDYRMIRYDPAGNIYAHPSFPLLENWNNVYYTGVGGADIPVFIGTELSHQTTSEIGRNGYVTGRSYTNPTNLDDIATIKVGPLP